MCAKHQKRSNNAELHNMSAEDFAQHILDWLECADDDLASARLLYENKHYSNSLYHLQQSVEKATKAFGIGLKLVQSVSDIQSGIGHKSLNLVEKGTTKYYSNSEKLPKEFQILNKEIGEQVLTLFVDIFIRKMDVPDDEQEKLRRDAVAEFKNRSTKGISELKQTAKRQPERKEFDFYLKEMEVMKEMLLDTDNVMNMIQNDDEMFNNMKNQSIISNRDIFISNSITSESEFDAKVEENKESIDTLFEQFSNQFIYLFCLSNYIWGFITPLSLITGNIESSTRYPDTAPLYNPHRYYSEEHILVQKFGALAEYTECLLAALYKYFELSNGEFGKITRE